MTTVFISGSMQIKNIDKKVKDRIDNIISSGFDIVLGDASGVDSSIQDYLCKASYQNVTIFHSGDSLRNNLGHWKTHNTYSKYKPGTRAFFTAKDIEMASIADYGLMVWDTKSTGTLCNAIEMLANKKKTVVFINKIKEFVEISNANDFENLISYMSENVLVKADKKIGLKKKIESLKYKENSLFPA